MTRSAWQRLADLRVCALAAAVFVPCFLVIAWRGALYFVVLVNLLLVLAMVELLRLQRAKRLEPDAGVAFAGAVVLPWSLFLQHGVFDDLALAALFVAAPLRVLRKRAADNSMDALSYILFSSMQALSDTGSFPFDERADGFVMGEGVGMFLLKRR